MDIRPLYSLESQDLHGFALVHLSLKPSFCKLARPGRGTTSESLPEYSTSESSAEYPQTDCDRRRHVEMLDDIA